MKTTRAFIIKPTLLCDGLKQISKRSISYSTDEHERTVFTLTTSVPPFVLPYYWKLYELSEEDVLLQSNSISPKFYWLSALLHGIDASASCLKASFACMDQVLISSKPAAIKKIIKSEGTNLFKKSVFLHDFTFHKPLTPKIIVSKAEMLQISKLVVTNIKPFDIVSVQGFFKWKDNAYLPVFLAEDAILLNRVVLETDFNLSGKQQSYMSKPLVVLNLADNNKYVLAEDVFLAALETSF